MGLLSICGILRKNPKNEFVNLFFMALLYYASIFCLLSIIRTHAKYQPKVNEHSYTVMFITLGIVLIAILIEKYKCSKGIEDIIILAMFLVLLSPFNFLGYVSNTLISIVIIANVITLILTLLDH